MPTTRLPGPLSCGTGRVVAAACRDVPGSPWGSWTWLASDCITLDRTPVGSAVDESAVAAEMKATVDRRRA